MSKRFFALCLALALCLSLIPAAVFADAPLFSYKEIPTGVDASMISITENGLGSYIFYWEKAENVREKGVIDPSGEVLHFRKPGSEVLFISGIQNQHFCGVGDSFVDMRWLLRYEDESTGELTETYIKNAKSYFDWKIYDKSGEFRAYACDIVAAYEGVPVTEIAGLSEFAYFGTDGYLTVYANDPAGMQSVYIIELQTLQVVFKQPREQAGSMTSVSDGLIAYTDYSSGVSAKHGGGWKDITGKQMISIDTDAYSECGNFSCGRALVWGKKSGGFGYVDKTAKEVIPCIYQEAGTFRDGYACVQNETGNYGYIDTAGKTVIPFEYNRAFGYGDGLFAVGVRDENYVYSCGLVDINNNIVVPMIYDSITYVNDDTAYALKEGKVVVLRLTYEGPAQNYPMVKSNGKTTEFDVAPALRRVTVKGSQSASEPVFVASYDESGRFLGVEIVTKEEDTVSYDGDAKSLLLLGADGELRPAAEAIEVDLTALGEEPPVDDVQVR